MNAIGGARMGVRVTGAIQLVLGLIVWTGRADGLIPIHMLVGLLLVISLWTLAFLAARAGAGGGLAVVAFLLGLVLPILGMTQEGLLAGSSHWVIQVIHLVLGIAAIGTGEALGTQVRRPEATTAA